MKILYLGMDGLAPEILFEDEQVSEKLLHFHQLMDMGCFGIIEKSEPPIEENPLSLRELSLWDGNQRIVPSNENSEWLDGDWDSFQEAAILQSRKRFDEVIQHLTSPQWNYLEYLDAGLTQIVAGWNHLVSAGSVTEAQDPGLHTAIRDYYLHLDAQLAKIFENIGEELILTVVSRHGKTSEQPGYLILVAPENPLAGELEGVKMLNIRPTLLDLAGYALPDTDKAESLVYGYQKSDPSGTLSKEEEDLLRERLSGLGYIS
jgi:predicted AlkP superfamily phosphohydrolase/phosphomutase